MHVGEREREMEKKHQLNFTYITLSELSYNPWLTAAQHKYTDIPKYGYWNIFS